MNGAGVMKPNSANISSILTKTSSKAVTSLLGSNYAVEKRL
jgi:hypothetical protein